MRKPSSSPILTAAFLVASGTSCDREPRPHSRVAPAQPLAAGSRQGGVDVTLGEDFRAVAGQTIYVPAYSAVSTSNDARPFNLAVTLSVRNTDRDGSIIVSRVRYHNRDGALVRDSLKKAVRLGPLASLDVFLKESDTSGGSSSSFIVEWVADRQVSSPVVEAVMIGTASSQGISFVCPGRVVLERGR